jgi:hypothetical protein
MTDSEIRVLGALALVQLTMWALGCLGHYWGEENERACMRVKAPGWLRKVFGDFRKDGTLGANYLIVQSAGYVTMLVALLGAMRSDLTRQHAIELWLAQFILTGVTVILVCDIVPRLFRRKQ